MWFLDRCVPQLPTVFQKVASSGVWAVDVLTHFKGRQELQSSGSTEDTQDQSFCVNYGNLYQVFVVVSVSGKLPSRCDLLP
jgi:hypothetical protein